MPPYIKNASKNNNSCGIKNMPHNSSYNLPNVNNTATMSSSAPAVSTFTLGPVTNSGLQSRHQPHYQSITFEPHVSTNHTTACHIPPITSNIHHQNSYRNMPAPSAHSTQHTFNLNAPIATTFNNNTSSIPPYLFTNVNYNSHVSQGQLHARQSLPKELPIFSGQPEEWPFFASTFKWSTKICGFTDAENLIRLQKCLSGGALKKVQHVLVHPSSVNWVMSILKLLYGQPENIVNSIKNRIKSTPPIDENDLPSFTTFAINVKSLIATIEASNLNNEINNSSLLQELIQKLPPCYPLQWGVQKLQLLNQNKLPNIYEFSNWIFNIGISATYLHNV